MMIEAPLIGTSVLLTTLTDPPLTSTVDSVLGYDPDHRAWRVVLSTDRCMRVWVQERSPAYGEMNNFPLWKAYDQSQPLAMRKTS